MTQQKHLDSDQNVMSFDQLYARWAEPIYFHVRRIVLLHEDADDVLQNTFVKVWKNMDRFRGESQWSTWLYRIATNEALDLLRKRNRLAGLQIDDIEGRLANQLVSDPLFDGDRVEALLHEAIATLPEKQRVVFLLRYYDDLKYNIISEITETSVGGLKANYHHAVEKIKNFLKGKATLNLSIPLESKEE